MVFPTKPNSTHGDIFFINLASDVPPLVDSFGFILVIFLIVFLEKFVEKVSVLLKFHTWYRENRLLQFLTRQPE